MIKKELNKNKSKKLHQKSLLIFYIAVLLLPLILMISGIIPKKFSLGVLFLVTGLIILCVFREHISLKELGISTHATKKEIIIYMLFTLVGVGTIMLYSNFTGKTFYLPKEIVGIYFLVLVASSFSQEFLLRSVLIQNLRIMVHSSWIIIIINTILFVVMHSIYSDFFSMFPLLFIGGIGFASIYLIYPNLPLIGISHTILNLFALSYGWHQ